MKKYDVVIIGAGPAGSSLAHALAKSGIHACIIDKKNFPRNKVCAGGLPARIIDLIPFDVTFLFLNDVREVSLTHNLQNKFDKKYDKTLIYTVNREKFDNFLLCKATEAGAVLMEGLEIESISSNNEHFILKTAKGDLGANIIVGADGANSFTAKSAGLNPIIDRHVAIQTRISIENVPQYYNNKTLIALDWGFMEDGYGWLFPNGSLASIGVMGPQHSGPAVKAYFDKWLTHFGLNSNECEVEAYNIPHRINERSIASNRILLIGDAAGLADYWTGEGIYYAIKSAQIAAKQIEKFLQGDAKALDEYENIIDKEILSELRASYLFSKLFNRISLPIFKSLKNYHYPWDIFCRIMSGERTFQDIKKRLRPDILLSKILFKNKRNQ